MGCCASTEAEVEEVGQVPVTQAEAGSTAADEIKVSLNIAETDAVKAKAGVCTECQHACGAAAVAAAAAAAARAPLRVIPRIRATCVRMPTYADAWVSPTISACTE